tara:strand:+ start:1887 stop:2324 length:438 start_codon:yes stop_codon:yes gene_type:complete
MSKKIIKITEDMDGYLNPKTNLSEKPAYFFLFDDETKDILFRDDIKTYLSIGCKRTVKFFSKSLILTDKSSTRVWIVVFDNYEGHNYAPPKFYELITEGYENRLDAERKKFIPEGSPFYTKINIPSEPVDDGTPPDLNIKEHDDE